MARWSAVLLALLFASGTAVAGGPLGIDHEWSLDQHGIWARRYQTALEFGAIVVEAGGALWLGNDDALGHTLWQSLDASLMTGIATEALKYSFSRARPDQNQGPNAWFRGRCCQSFPSGEVGLQASVVMPLILRYQDEHPWVWSLELLPLYDSVARMKSQAHWQTDVIAAWAMGSAFGYWASTFHTPVTVQMLPHGLTVGISRRF